MIALKSIAVIDDKETASLAHVELRDAQLLELSQGFIATITKLTWGSSGTVRIPGCSTKGES
jgi:hypothetical protein